MSENRCFMFKAWQDKDGGAWNASCSCGENFGYWFEDMASAVDVARDHYPLATDEDYAEVDE